MISETRPLADITHEAIKILFREIGVVNTIRFINQYTTGFGDYTEQRRELFTDQTLDELIDEIKQRRAKMQGDSPT